MQMMLQPILDTSNYKTGDLLDFALIALNIITAGQIRRFMRNIRHVWGLMC